MVGGVAGEDVGEAGLDADPDEREQPGRSHASAGELLVAEHARRSPSGCSGCGSESVIAMSRYVQPRVERGLRRSAG